MEFGCQGQKGTKGLLLELCIVTILNSLTPPFDRVLKLLFLEENLYINTGLIVKYMWLQWVC